MARIYDVQSEAKTMDRFEFVATFVARCTTKKTNREATNGMHVRKVSGGWVYGFHGMSFSCAPVSAARLYDMIRRSPLNHYVQQAEDFRSDVHLG